MDTFSTGSLKINDMATDPSSPSSSTLILANDQTSSGSIISMSDTGGALSSSTETTLHTLSSTTPGYVNLETGSNQVWWDVNSSKTVGEYNIPGSSYSTYSAPSSFTAVGPMATSADGSTVIVADTGSTGAVQEFGSVSPFGNTNSLSIGGQIGGIAPAAATAGSWDAYVVVGNNIEVVNTATQSVTQIIPDAYTPKAIVASPDGNYIYIANEFGSGSNEGSISEISITNEDLSGYGFTTPVTVSEQTGQPGVEPYFTSIAINPQGTDLFGRVERICRRYPHQLFRHAYVVGHLPWPSRHRRRRWPRIRTHAFRGDRWPRRGLRLRHRVQRFVQRRSSGTRSDDSRQRNMAVRNGPGGPEFARLWNS